MKYGSIRIINRYTGHIYTMNMEYWLYGWGSENNCYLFLYKLDLV